MNVEISRLRNIEEIDEVVDVFQQCGKGIDRELVLKYFHCGIITVARHNGHIIGCLLIADWRPLETMTWQRIIPSLRSDPAAESLEQMVVLDGYRNRGIGTEMVENAMAKISIIIRNPHSILPYDRWLAVSRLPRDGGPSSINLLLRLGFRELGRDESFYADDEPGCPSCGDGVCSCTGVLMEWRRNGG